MDFRRKDDVLELSDLDPFLAELLRQIPASTKCDDAAVAEQRIFSEPAPPNEKEICAEWKVYVQQLHGYLLLATLERVS